MKLLRNFHFNPDRYIQFLPVEGVAVAEQLTALVGAEVADCGWLAPMAVVECLRHLRDRYKRHRLRRRRWWSCRSLIETRLHRPWISPPPWELKLEN